METICSYSGKIISLRSLLNISTMRLKNCYLFLFYYVKRFEYFNKIKRILKTEYPLHHIYFLAEFLYNISTVYPSVQRSSIELFSIDRRHQLFITNELWMKWIFIFINGIKSMFFFQTFFH